MRITIYSKIPQDAKSRRLMRTAMCLIRHRIGWREKIPLP